MTNKEKIDNIRLYQLDSKKGFVHPLTCGLNSKHNILIPTEEEKKVVLKCEECGYIQHSIPAMCMMWSEMSILRKSLVEGSPLFRLNSNEPNK